MSRRLAAALALSLPLLACDPTAAGTGAIDEGDASASDALAADATGAVDPQLAADLAFLREEEKLARDVYTSLYAAHALMPLLNISRSEETHAGQVAALLAAKGLPDPVVDDAVGAFVDADLDALYDQLVAAGGASEVAALSVGATVEDRDLRDLQAMSARTGDQAALTLYANLACGSRNHLRAFVSLLAARGATYAAQSLPQAEVDAIAASAREDCGGGVGEAGAGSGSGGAGSGGGTGSGPRGPGGGGGGGMR